MDAIQTKSTARRDRLLLLRGPAIVLLTLPGSACEAVAHDPYLKAKIEKKRRHSLLREALMAYELTPHLREGDLARVIEALAKALQGHRAIGPTACA